jgi:drug/metabolite transporter (DMT)-like permease
MHRRTATAVGFVAVLLWSLLAVLTTATAPVPPLLLNAVTFAVGGIVGLVWITVKGEWRALARVRWPVYLFGTAGLFGYHFLYFSALRHAPAAEASLIAYLWPLFIVLFSGLLPGERIGYGHVAGAALAFSGVAIILTSGSGISGVAAAKGYIYAFLCALTWAAYSVASRRLGDVPTAVVAVYCLATAVVSAALHLLYETAAWPSSAAGWAAVLALGAGPVGLAFYVWDVGVKRGDIQLLGVASYAAPILSTLVLVAAGQSRGTPALVLSAALVVGGAALAATASARVKASAVRQV